MAKKTVLPRTGARARTAEVTLVEGVIVALNRKKRLYTVETNAGETISECIYAVGGIFAPLLGFNFTGILEPGTHVTVLRGANNFITHTLPSSVADEAGAAKSKVGLGADATPKLAESDDPQGSGQDTPEDMVEGEFSITNAMGTGIDFLTSMLRLRSGGAAIEVGMRDDMLRLIAERFQFFGPLGETDELNDGRLDSMQQETSYPHEALGKLTPEEATARFAQPGVIEDPTAEDLLRSGRWRYQRFRGFVGDFINTWVTMPEAVLGRVAYQGAAGYKAGLSRHWEGADGSLLWQTVSEIAFERVVRIPVPMRKKSPDAQENRDYYKNLDRQFLKLWDYGADLSDARLSAFQIREYARYLSQFAGYARFLQQSDRFSVPSEAASPAPSWTAREADREAANPNIEYIETYATIRILRSGGIMMLEGGGAGAIYEKGEAFFFAPKHMHFESGGDMRFTCGRDMWLKTRRNITISATVGGLWLKARTAFNALCEKGSLYLKSDGSDDEIADSGGNKPQREFGGAGIILESTRSGVICTGNGKVTINSDSQDDDALIISAKKNLIVRAGEALQFKAKSTIFAVTLDFSIRARRFVAELTSRKFILNRMMQVSAARLDVNRVVSNYLHAVSSVSTQNGQERLSKDTISEPVVPTNSEPEIPASFSEPVAIFSEPRPLWAFPPAAVNSYLYESLAQQFLRREPPAEGYSVWNENSDDALLPATGTVTGSLPFPQKNSRLIHNGGQRLDVPSNQSGAALSTRTPLVKAEPTVFYFMNHDA